MIYMISINECLFLPQMIAATSSKVYCGKISIYYDF